MDRLPQILEDMKVSSTKPNVITYSTMLKGHCQNGNVQAGFAILDQMKKEKDSRLKPDEIMYNSLLDGCAQSGLLEEGLQLVEEITKKYRFRPNAHVYTNLIQACASNQQLP